MERFRIVRIKEQIKQKVLSGDFVTLGRLINQKPDTARQRFNRDKQDAVIAMRDFIKQRENFIKNYEQKDEN